MSGVVRSEKTRFEVVGFDKFSAKGVTGMTNCSKQTPNQVADVCLNAGWSGVAVVVHSPRTLPKMAVFNSSGALVSVVRVPAGFTTVVLVGIEVAEESTIIIVDVTAKGSFHGELSDQDEIHDALKVSFRAEHLKY